MLIKVTTQNLRSVCPALASCEGRRISGSIQYVIGEWVEKIPNSMGIFIYETEDPKLIWTLSSHECRFFECEAEGLREPEVMLDPLRSRVIDVSREELGVLLGLSKPDALFFMDRWEFKNVLPIDDRYRILVASRIKLVRELKFERKIDA